MCFGQSFGYIWVRKLSSQLIRAIVHKHRQRADSVLFQSARFRLGDAGVHERRNRRLGDKFCRQSPRSGHVSGQADGLVGASR